MAVDIKATLNEIMKWPVSDQIAWLQEAWDRLIDSGWEPELSDAQKSEFDQRLDDLEANPNSAVNLESLIERVRRPR